MNAKAEFARRAVGMISAMANHADVLESMTQVYLDRGYDALDPITDEDLAELEITAADFTEIVGVIVRFGQWFNGETVLEADNRAVANRFRTDI